MEKYYSNGKEFSKCGCWFRLPISILANIKLRLKVKTKPTRHKKFDIQKLKDADTREIFEIKIGGRFEPLLNIPDTDLEVDDIWEKIKIKNSSKETAQEVLGIKNPKPQISWLTAEVLKLCDERREVKQQKLIR